MNKESWRKMQSTIVSLGNVYEFNELEVGLESAIVEHENRELFPNTLFFVFVTRVTFDISMFPTDSQLHFVPVIERQFGIGNRYMTSTMDGVMVLGYSDVLISDDNVVECFKAIAQRLIEVGKRGY